MKKNISINLQGMIFHIEEDGYEQLSQYLAAIKSYFSAYEGHEEITADIESRIAEIFAAKLAPTKQVITRDDVLALMAQMGGVKDFQILEEEEAGAGQPHGQHYANTNASSANAGSFTGTASANGTYSKRIYRDVNRKVLSGVAAGIANYLNLDPLWVRLGFVLLTFLFALPGGFPAGIIFITYLLCWIAFPKSYLLPETSPKKLFRNAYDKKLGGVASGMALYFGIDVAIIRLIFLVSAILGGFGLLTYFVLWIIVPEANSLTDRVQMEGNPITLSGIEETLKNNLRMQDENGAESKLARIILLPMRLLSQIIQFLARILSPLLNVLITLIRIVAGALLLFISGVAILALFVVIATALKIIDGSAIISMGDIPFSMFAESYPEFGLVSGFVAILIPLLFILFLGLSLLVKHFYLRPNVSWPMLGIWIVSLFLLALSAVDFMNNFKESGEITIQKAFPVAPYETVLLKSRNNNQSWGNTTFEMETYAGPEVKLIHTFAANGITETDAIKNAEMITYHSSQADSALILDTNFKYKPHAIYRNQKLNVKLLLPENKKFRISDDLSWRLMGYFDENTATNDRSKYVWQAKNNKFICLNCPPPDTTAKNTSADESAWENADLEAESILMEAEDYGNNTHPFNFTNFEKIKVRGALHVKINAGNRFTIQARGAENVVSSLEINQDGSDLRIQQNSFRLPFKNQEPVLITITMPELNDLDLSGAVKVEVAGFKTDNFKLAASGAVQTLLAISSQDLRIDASGACKTILIGSGENLTVDASGASEIRAHQYKVSNAKVDLSGVCKARVFSENRLIASAAGPSQITYSGNPSSIQKDESGMGRIEKE